MDDELVGDHHDRSVGDLPAELGDQAAVEAPPSLLAVHQEDRLPELAVARVALAEARPCHFWKGGEEGFTRRGSLQRSPLANYSGKVVNPVEKCRSASLFDILFVGIFGPGICSAT